MYTYVLYIPLYTVVYSTVQYCIYHCTALYFPLATLGYSGLSTVYSGIYHCTALYIAYIPLYTVLYSATNSFRAQQLPVRTWIPVLRSSDLSRSEGSEHWELHMLGSSYILGIMYHNPAYPVLRSAHIAQMSGSEHCISLY